MEDYFSIGELSRYQNISKQTLIFYDKLGLFQPAYVDPNNGYRYYTARQLDELDTILILKKSGLSLQRIKELLEHYTTESSQKVLREQLGAIDRQMEELRLLRSRLSQRCSQLEDANLHKGEPPRPSCPLRKPAGRGTSSGCLGGCAPPCTTGGTISPLAPRMKGCWPSAGSGG